MNKMEAIDSKVLGEKFIYIAVDIQKGFITSNTKHILDPISKFLSNLKKDSPIFATRFINHPNSNWEKLLHWDEFMSPPAINLEISVAEHIASERIINKTEYSSFTPEIRSYAKDKGVTDVIIFGISTDSCVMATAFAVFDAGYTPWVITDCTASFASELNLHKNSLEIIGHFIGIQQLINSKQVLKMVSR
jgi:nicotinamidase-related amidase